MKTVLSHIQSIIEDRSFGLSKYKIMSYAHLETKLIIYYHDRNEVFEFSHNSPMGEFKEIDHFFTHNKEHEDRIEQATHWISEYERDTKG